ncbi:MAG: hypothetical protein QOH71_644 [Blastocatellia bacterium]|jgi:hypothetical protein|nr:hypothetical protein [Blastocatellia bacterium]
MNPGIFLVQSNDELIEMNEQPYDSEDVLQTLLAKYPSLLAGHQINSEKPRRWLLVERECGVPSEEGGGSRWSIDHLFLDQDAIPTFVEVKQSTNTDIRRKIVGQMMDYAANAVDHWPVPYMQERFAASCRECGLEPDEKLSEFLGNDAEPEEFWAQADRNLRDGNIRLIFVGDKIPNELRRIVEFLNKRMNPTEVLAFEIRQFVGAGQKGLVPTVIGKTTEPPPAPRPHPVSRTAEEIIEVIREKSPQEAEIAQRILNWSKPYFTPKCAKTSLRLDLTDSPNTFHPVSIDTGGHLWTYNKNIQSTRPFDVAKNWTEFRRRIDDNPGVNFRHGETYSNTKLSSFADDAALSRFLNVIAWSIEQVKNPTQDKQISASSDTAQP